MNEDWLGEEVLSIDDPRLPDILRDHGRRFKKAAKFVIIIEPNQYTLYSEDGDLLDLCFIG